MAFIDGPSRLALHRFYLCPSVVPTSQLSRKQSTVCKRIRSSEPKRHEKAVDCFERASSPRSASDRLPQGWGFSPCLVGVALLGFSFPFCVVLSSFDGQAPTQKERMEKARPDPKRKGRGSPGSANKAEEEKARPSPKGSFQDPPYRENGKARPSQKGKGKGRARRAIFFKKNQFLNFLMSKF